jgi:uncharacterized protein YhjY with autotransporter beta-barrel domain
MNTTSRLFFLAALGGLLLPRALPQTAVWIGQGNLATFGDNWVVAGNWDTGAVPDGAAVTAVISQVTPAVRNYPDGPYLNAPSLPVASVVGGALPVVTGPITLGQLRFDLPAASAPYTAAVYVGNPGSGTPGSLRLGGAGLEVRTASFLTVDLNVAPGSTLTLANQARILRAGTPSVLHLYLSDSTATAANPARLLLRDDAAFDASAPLWTTVYSRGAASLVFQDRARAGYTFFQLAALNTVEFHNTASAESATFNLGVNNLLLFDGDSTAATSVINFGDYYAASNNSTIVRFAGRSTAAQSQITRSSTALNTAVEFTDQATGGSVNLTARRLDLSGAVTGTGTTGRLRATSSILAPGSVVADDVRTISAGTVQLQDLLLGSNTLQVAAGYIGNIRDSGGAYLSAAGENLVGGGLIKTGPGYLTLSSPTYNPADPTHPSYNVITGTTIVRQGTLSLYNRLADVIVESAGTLRGPGIVAGRLTNQGTVMPETTILHVTGDYAQTATGTFYPYFAYTPGYPTTFGLEIGGRATLAGRLVANTHPNMFAQWKPGVTQIQVLSAGSISGRFETFDTANNSARIDVSAVYASTTVTLRFEMLPFAALGLTPGARALGGYLDNVYRYTGNYFPANYNWLGDSLTFATNREQAAQTMANVGPERYGTVLEHGFATALARRTALDSAVGGNQGAVVPGPAMFAEGGRRRLSFAAVDGLPRAASSADTWLAGGRWQQGAWTLGGYVAGEKAAVRLDETNGTAKIDSLEPGLFARFAAKNFFVHAGAGFSRDRYDLRRTVDFIYSNHSLVHHTAAPDGRRTDWSLTAGHTWTWRGWMVSPFVGFMATRWLLDGFTETSDSTFLRSQLQVEGWARDSRRARAGFEAAGRTLSGRLQPRLTVVWWHEFATDRSIPARLVGAPATYLAPGRPADLDTFQANLALDYQLGRGAALYLSGGAAEGRNTTLTSDLSAGFRWEF